MGKYIFEVTDKTGRKIHLSKERWKHIREEHPEIVEFEDIKQTINLPDKITQSDRDSTVYWYSLHNKKKKRYLKVSVKYINRIGFIITSHYTTKIH